MNNLGEISHLVSIANTDIRVITNILNAHIGNFKDGIEGIFKAKTEILENADSDVILVACLQAAACEPHANRPSLPSATRS